MPLSAYAGLRAAPLPLPRPYLSRPFDEGEALSKAETLQRLAAVYDEVGNRAIASAIRRSLTRTGEQPS